MLQFLENGSSLYVMAVMFAFGVVSKIVVTHTYKRWMRQCSSLSTTKDGCLRQIKNKYETVYRANDGVKNCSVLIENQINAYRILKVPIQKWENFTIHAALFCFFIGVGTSFLCFWYSLGVRPIVLHFVAGVLFGVALVMVDGITDTATRKDMIVVFLQDYLENNMSSQIERDGANETRKAVIPVQRSGMKDDIFMKKKDNGEDKGHGATWKLRERRRIDGEEKYMQESWEESERRAKIEKVKNNETLRREIEQIAATREPSEERERRKLTPEEEQLLEEIIKEYLN